MYVRDASERRQAPADRNPKADRRIVSRAEGTSGKVDKEVLEEGEWSWVIHQKIEEAGGMDAKRERK